MFLPKADFDDALQEIEILVAFSREYQSDELKRSLFLKSGILFLSTKLECFFEDVIEEYIYKIEQLNLTADKLPEPLVMSAIHYHFSDDMIAKINHKKPVCRMELKKILPFIEMNTPINKIKIDTKFSYGKHGSKVVHSLFARIGIEDIFNKCKIYVTEETMLSDESEIIEIDIKSDVDSLTGIRNGIIHENKNPSISEETVENYMLHFRKFVQSITDMLDQSYTKLLTEVTK